MRMFKKIIEYIPEFFIFTPMIVWCAAFFTRNLELELAFLEMHWWMIFGIVLYANNLISEKLKNFL